MLQELQKFYNNLEAQKAEVLNQDVETIVAEKVAKYAETVRAEVQSEIKAQATILDIKMEAISDAMEVVKLTAQREESFQEAPILAPVVTSEESI